MAADEPVRLVRPLQAAQPPAMRAVDAGILLLEPQTATHAAAMFQVLSDPAIYLYENQPPASLESLRTRFARLESRQSADGSQQWLNWVIRLPGGALAGYVQATVYPDRRATIAYELASAYWGRSLARTATEAMLRELVASYGVDSFSALLKRDNLRSLHLLQRLGFRLASAALQRRSEVPPDELLMVRRASAGGGS